MPRMHGKGGKVKVDSDGGGSPLIVLGITAWSVDYKCAADDATGMDSAGKKAFLAGMTEWSGSFNGVWDVTETDTIDNPPLISIGTRLELELWLDDSVDYVGDCLVTSFKPEVATDGIVKISIDFQGTEGLT